MSQGGRSGPLTHTRRRGNDYAVVIGGEHAGTGTIVVSLILALVVTWIAFNVSNLVIEGDANKFNLANGLGWILSSTPTDTSEDRILSDSEIKGLDATIKEKKAEKRAKKGK